MEDPRQARLAPPLRLADIAVAGAGPDLDTILTRVREGVEELKQDFTAAALVSLAQLEAGAAELHAGRESGATSDQDETLRRVYRESHDLRGLGGTFDYPLITHIGSSLCDLIERLESLTERHLEAIELHVRAMKLVLAERLTGDGGAQGQALAAGIEELAGKLRDGV